MFQNNIFKSKEASIINNLQEKLKDTVVRKQDCSCLSKKISICACLSRGRHICFSINEKVDS
jgi:hypothetical protein